MENTSRSSIPNRLSIYMVTSTIRDELTLKVRLFNRLIAEFVINRMNAARG